MGQDIERLEESVSALDQVHPEAAATIRGVLERRAPDLLRALENADIPTMALREQVEDLLADEFSGEVSGPDWEPTSHGRRVDDALGRFLMIYPITAPTKAIGDWPPEPDLRGDRAGRP